MTPPTIPEAIPPTRKTDDIPGIFGIINLTPDSFSDGGRFASVQDAVDAAVEMLDAGAWAIDAGAESTRPGAAELPPEIELERIAPFVRQLLERRPDARLSIDTRKASVASAALDAGALIINDVSAMSFDPRMAETVAARGHASAILTHSRGTPATMRSPEFLKYGDVAAETAEELLASVERAVEKGVARKKIILDPGLGFAKTPEQDMTLVCEAGRLKRLLGDFPLFYGASRKSFLSVFSPQRKPFERDVLTMAVLHALQLARVEFVRVHNVRDAAESMRVFAAAAKGCRS